MSTPKPPPKCVRMLSLSLPPASDQDKKKRRKTSQAEVTPRSNSGSGSPGTATPMNTTELRASLLDCAVEGGIAAAVGEDSNKENVFQSPPPPKCKGRHSFEAIDAVNVLMPIKSLVSMFEDVMICPMVDCTSKRLRNGELTVSHTMKVEYEQYGFATEMYVKCMSCGFAHAVCPPDSDVKK